MTEQQKVKAKSMELALQLMGLAYELPIKIENIPADDETGKLNEVFSKAEFLSRKFEAFILNNPRQ